MNTKYMIDIIRDMIGEATAAQWSDLNLLFRLNMVQSSLAQKIAMTPGQWLIKSVDLTPVASVITLPSDLSKPLYMEEKTSGRKLDWISSVADRRPTRSSNPTLDTYSREAYMLANTIEVNEVNYSTEVTLWYQFRIPDLHFGTASGGGASSLNLEASKAANVNNDYYNSSQIETISGTGAPTLDTITDYVGSTRVCTVTGTYDNTTVYGTISRLPEEAHNLLVYETALLALTKPSSTIDEKVFAFLSSMTRDAKKILVEWMSSRVLAGQRVAIREIWHD